MKKEILILPIFNQTMPGVLETFATIRDAAMKPLYSSSLPAPHIIKEIWTDQLKRHTNSFAFAALCDNQMAGFARGWCSSGTAHLENLFVLPQYWNQGIGGKLLYVAEHSASISAQRMKLRSLQHARTFYSERMGYNAVLSLPEYSEFEKKLSRTNFYMPLPVFCLSSSMAKKCTELAGKGCLSVSDINRGRRPFSVVLSADNELRGFALAGPDKKDDIIKTGSVCSEYVQTHLNRWLDNYRRGMQIIR